MSAFFCYQKVRRESLIKENPKMDNKKVVSVASMHKSHRKCPRSGAGST